MEARPAIRRASARFAAATLACTWATPIYASGKTSAGAVALAGAGGAVVVGGTYEGAIDFGGGRLVRTDRGTSSR